MDWKSNFKRLERVKFKLESHYSLLFKNLKIDSVWQFYMTNFFQRINQ